MLKADSLTPRKEVHMGDELKSTLDIILAKVDGMEGVVTELSADQKERIAEIRKKYEAKMAEAKILLKNDEELPSELARLEEKREDEINKVRQES